MTHTELRRYVFHTLERAESTISYLSNLPRYAEKHTRRHDRKHVGAIMMILCDYNYHLRQLDDIIMNYISHHQYFLSYTASIILNQKVILFLANIHRLNYINSKL